MIYAGLYGTNVGAYFVLVRWVMGLNTLIFLMMTAFVVLPQVNRNIFLIF